MNTPAIQRVTVIGTGMMGPGIATRFAAGGKQVTLAARTEASLSRGRSSLENCLRDLEVDTAIKTGLGLRFPVYGPLEHGDVAGLDLLLAIHSYLFRELCNATEPLPILKEKVEKGDVGARAGHGFYDWTQRDVAQTKAARDAFIKARLKDLYPPQRAPVQE